jgi:aryl-alcohol dehydrogenase-like predicted oxidoreductase
LTGGKLCLGTVKIGVPSYGYSTTIDPDKCNTLLPAATEIGITCFDTSPRYKDSERIIGNFVKNNKKKLFISTKIDNLDICDEFVVSKMRESIFESIENLGHVDLYYLHQNEISVISNNHILESIRQLKNEGLIKEVGASIYSMDELDFILESNSFDWVQIPVNILDVSFYNRIIESNSTIKIAVRSIFLQGIIFHPEMIIESISDANEMISLLNKVKSLGSQYDLELIDLSVAYICSLPLIDQVLVGTTNIRNLKRIERASRILLNTNIKSAIGEIASTNKSWTNPRLWNKYI